jgi:hypothetical protein
MMSQSTQLASEDGLSFVSAGLAAAATFIPPTGSPRTLLIGLVIAAIAKTLPSLQDDHFGRHSIEDWLLFLAALIGTLGAGLRPDLTFSNSDFLIYALVFGVFGKTIPSLLFKKSKGWNRPKDWKMEDVLPIFIAASTLVASLFYGSQYALVGVLFSFLVKTGSGFAK